MHQRARREVCLVGGCPPAAVSCMRSRGWECEMCSDTNKPAIGSKLGDAPLLQGDKRSLFLMAYPATRPSTQPPMQPPTH
jgi:hypothetical protein